MGFLSTLLRSVRCPTLHTVIREGVNRQILWRTFQQLTQCRALMITHRTRDQEKPGASEKVDLDAWKNILRSATPKPESEEVVEEESIIESLKKDVELWRLAGKSVPDNISTEQLQTLLQLSTKTARNRYLNHLMLKERKQKNKEKKKLEKQQSKSYIEIHEKRWSYFLSFWISSLDSFHKWRCAQAMKFGQPLVFDMSYDHYMSQRELVNTISQLQLCESSNIRAVEPFHIHFCNLQPDGPYHQQLVKQYQGAWDDLLITATEKSYMEIFPKDQLVYLTGDSPNVLKTFDHNKIYIIGAFVDKSQKAGVSLGKAKQLQLATARLPLDKFLKWNCGAKNLTLNQVTEILLTIKDIGDWKKALASVPRRKHHGYRGESFQKSPIKF